MVPLNKPMLMGIGTNHSVSSESFCPSPGSCLHTITVIKSIRSTEKSTVSPTEHTLPDFEFVKQNIALTHSFFCDLIHFLYILHSYLAGVFNLLLNRTVIDTYSTFLDIIYAFAYIYQQE